MLGFWGLPGPLLGGPAAPLATNERRSLRPVAGRRGNTARSSIALLNPCAKTRDVWTCVTNATLRWIVETSVDRISSKIDKKILKRNQNINIIVSIIIKMFGKGIGNIGSNVTNAMNFNKLGGLMRGGGDKTQSQQQQQQPSPHQTSQKPPSPQQRSPVAQPSQSSAVVPAENIEALFNTAQQLLSRVRGLQARPP